MEIAITVVICVTVVIVVAVWQFGSYLDGHGPLHAWKEASLRGYLYNDKSGKVILITPKERLGPKHPPIVEAVKKEDTNEIVVTMTAKFVLDEFQALL